MFLCPCLSAADILGARVIGVVLTGANSDGNAGLKAISDKGGATIVQNPATALAQTMPQSAIDLVSPDHITTLEELPALLVRLADTPVIL